MAPQAGQFEEILRRVRTEAVPLVVGEYVRDDALNNYGVLDVLTEHDMSRISRKLTEFNGTALDAAIGAVVGCAIGDAVGAPLEFLPATDRPDANYVFSSDTLEYGGHRNVFSLQRGQWTDDASMALCMADSLLVCGGFDGSDLRVRFWNWWCRGYNNAFRYEPNRSGSVGLGGNISKSLYSMRPGVKPPPEFGREHEDAGIGSIMRLSPVPVFYHRDIEASVEFARASSLTTHPGALAAEACAFLAFTISRAVSSRKPVDLTSDAVASATQNIARETGGGEDRAGAPRVDTRTFLEEAAEGYLARLDAAESAGTVEGRSLAALQAMRRLLRSEEGDASLERCWNW